MTTRIPICLLTFALSVVANADPVLTPAAVEKLLPTGEGTVETERLRIPLRVAKNLSIEATFAITSKGNGLLVWPGGSLHIYDAHDDTDLFDPPLLNNNMIDVDADGFLDLVVWGTVVLTGEKESDPVTRQAIVSVLRFDPTRRQFVNTVPSAFVQVTLQSNQPLHPDALTRAGERRR